MKFCSLSSGSSGNCIYVGSDRTKVLIDIGISTKKTEVFLKSINVDPRDIDAVFITHEHFDHISGVSNFLKKYNIPIFSTYDTYLSLIRRFNNINKVEIIEGSEFEFKDLEVFIFNTPHDASDPVSYKIRNKEKVVSVATDLGFFSEDIKKFLMDSNIILIESNYDENLLKASKYPLSLKKRILSNLGHLSNNDCGHSILALLQSGKKNIILGHLSENSNFPQLAYNTVKNILVKNNIDINKDINLTIAHRNLPSNYITI